MVNIFMVGFKGWFLGIKKKSSILNILLCYLKKILFEGFQHCVKISRNLDFEQFLADCLFSFITMKFRSEFSFEYFLPNFRPLL